MKLTATMVTMIVLWGALPARVLAAEPNSADGKTSIALRGASAGRANPPLRAEIHQTLAALQEARAAQPPDAAKIAQLEESLRQLRQQCVAQPGPGPGYGLGYGPGRSMGYGRGAGAGGGNGYRGGRGPGPNCWGGPGFGMGPGCGFGPGGGFGMGPGRGFGPGGGQGRAPGGPWFVDENNDGVCDRFQQRNAAAK